MLLLKSLHLIFIVTWFAALFYLPRLFVYHAMAKGTDSCKWFNIMQKKLYYIIACPSAIFTILSGTSLLIIKKLYLIWPLWLIIKLFLITFMIVYHLYCGYYVSLFNNNNNNKTHTFFRIFNEIPVIFLVTIIFLAVFKFS